MTYFLSLNSCQKHRCNKKCLNKKVSWIKFIPQILKSKIKHPTEMDPFTWTLQDLQSSLIWGKMLFGSLCTGVEQWAAQLSQPWETTEEQGTLTLQRYRVSHQISSPTAPCWAQTSLKAIFLSMDMDPYWRWLTSQGDGCVTRPAASGTETQRQTHQRAQGLQQSQTKSLQPEPSLHTLAATPSICLGRAETMAGKEHFTWNWITKLHSTNIKLHSISYIAQL